MRCSGYGVSSKLGVCLRAVACCTTVIYEQDNRCGLLGATPETRIDDTFRSAVMHSKVKTLIMGISITPRGLLLPDVRTHFDRAWQQVMQDLAGKSQIVSLVSENA